MNIFRHSGLAIWVSGVFAVIFILILNEKTACQKLEIFGYFEPQLMGAKIENKFYQLSSNKLRVDLQFKPSDKVAFGANFDYITYHGKTQWDILKFLPESVIDEAANPSFFGIEFNPYVLPFDDQHFLDNAYLKLSFKYADITIGKQQLSIGTGYAWNPTDVFNQKDMIDPTYEQPGHNAMRLDLPFGSGFGLTTIYAPIEDWNYTDLLLKLKGRFSHFDFSLLGIQKHWKFTDARVFDPILMNFFQLDTKREIIGADIVGELFGIGVWAEYAYNDIKIDNDKMNEYLLALERFTPPHLSIIRLPAMEIPENYYEFVAGIDYTFDFQTYVMCEYYRNTLAKADYKKYNLNDWMQLLSAEKKAISQDQLYLFIQHPLTDLITISSSAIASLSDKSFAIVPMMTYNIFENVDLNLFLNFYFGKEGTAYTKNLGNGGMFRARIYF